MPPADDLLNKGFIVSLAGQQAAGAGRTFIVTGLLRSGTSLVASILSQAGLFIGTQINDIVYEDEEIAGTLTSRRHRGTEADHRREKRKLSQLGIQAADAVPLS